MGKCNKMQAEARKSPKEKLNVLLGDIQRRVSFTKKKDIETEVLELNRAHHLNVNKPAMRSSITSMMSMSMPNSNFTNKMQGEARAQTMADNYVNEAPKFIIHPYSNFRIFWDLTTFALVTLNLVIIPMNIAFYSNQANRHTFKVFFLVSDIWFLTDILLNLRTGIVMDDSEMDVIFDPVEIRKAYVKSWFAIDLASSIPWDVIIGGLFTTGSDFEAEHATFTCFLKVVTILKLLRVTRLAKAIRNWEELLNFQYNISNEAAMKILQIAFMLFTVIHINGCMIFMAPMIMKFPGPDKDNGLIYGPCWVITEKLKFADPLEQYSWSVFKAASHMLCIGYGAAPPTCLVDMFVTVVSLLIGSVTFALMIAEITSLIQSLNSSSSSYKEKLTQVKEYMDFCKVPQHLRVRIREYYEVKFAGKMFNETAILEELNPLLREKVINYNCRSLVKSVEFLSTADPDFVSDLIAKLKFEVYLQGDEIIKEGTVGTTMYFVNSGTVQVSTKSQIKPRYLSEGEHFGEICLFVSNLKRTASIQATTHVAVYTLEASDFNQTLKWYPSEKVEMQRVAIERMEALLLQSCRQRDKITRNKEKLTMTEAVTDDYQDGDDVLDDDIYAELEMQRDALMNLHKRQVEADEIKKVDTANRQKGLVTLEL